MELYFLRHAIAEDPTTEKIDSERELTFEGKKKLTKVIKGIQTLELTFDLILMSPYKRTVQTASTVAKKLKIKNSETCEALAPGGSFGALSTRIAQEANTTRILLVGHQPGLGMFASMLAFGHTATSILPFSKAGMACVEINHGCHTGSGELKWFLTAKQMGMIN